MPRPRTPKLKAQITGRVMHDPQRFRNRNEPNVEGRLGDAPKWMSHEQKTAWESFSDELPWLNHSHRSLVEIASTVRARVITGEDVGVHALGLLRQCLGQLGATPADSSKVTLPNDEVEEDPADKYFRSAP
jgi:hypothetical protein